MKKKVLIIICACLSNLISYSQIENKKRDSLLKEIEMFQEDNSEKVELLYQLHKLYLKGAKYDSILIIQEEAERIANIIGDVESLAKVKVMEGAFFYKKRQTKKSIRSFKIAEELIQNVEISDLKYLVYSSLGISYYMLGHTNRELDSCLYFYYKAATFTREIPEDELAKTYARISQAYSILKKKDSVFVYIDKLLNLAKETKNRQVMSIYYTSQYNYYKEEREKDSTFKYMRLAYQEVTKQKKSSYDFKLKLNGEYNKMGVSFYSFRELDSALVYLDSCIELSIEIKDVTRLGRVILIVNYILGLQDKFEKSLNLTQKTLDFAYFIGDTSLIARSKLGMTYVYDNLKEYEKAIEVNNDLLDNYLHVMPLGTKRNLYANQSYFYYEFKDYVNAVKYGFMAFQMDSKNPNILYNLADAYLAAYQDSLIKKRKILPQMFNGEQIEEIVGEEEAKKRVLSLVKKYYEESLELLEEKEDHKNLVQPHNGLGDYYLIVGNEDKVIYHYEKAWEYSAEDNVPLKDQLRVSKRLYKLYKNKQNKSHKALYWLEVTDSLEKEQATRNDLKELGKKQAEFEFSQKLYADSLDQKEKDLKTKYEKEQQQLELKTEKEKKYYLYGGVILLLAFLFILYRRFQQTIKQKNIIELQKESIEEKRIALRKTHEGVQDSINYSKRIQKAIFPSLARVKSLFPNSFLFFKPKDVVSGDFYWVHKTDEGKRIIVTADCTGHGVPGAFMTIIGINILKEIIQEGVIDSATILKEINKRLIERLSQHGKDSVKDGMDLALCVIDASTVEFVGAHLPLYHVRDKELVEYKGGHIFLGSKLDMAEPKVHYIPYQKGDLIYMSTDGLPDQKGGEKGKKFYSKRLKEYLLSNSNLTMEAQETNLTSLRANWIGDKYEQLDDITVVGIRL